MKGASACAVAVLLAVLPACHADPRVTTGQGTVQGIYLTTNRDRNISAFLGIPFAQPPVGDLRFKNPVAAVSWNGTYDATKDGSECPQLSYGSTNVAGDEDCLYLNVYTPQLPDNGNTSLLPVMFFIHGGGFIMGSSDSSSQGPGYFLDRDVVLVATNYRLGLLGFLSTGDSEAPGNFGLKDQVMALKWTQENIKYFGGDPNRVTLFGGSAGGSCVHFLTMSDLTDGLFSQYIIQSGSLMATWNRTGSSSETIPGLNIANANALGEHLGCSTDTSALLVDCLRKVNVSTIMNANSIFYKWDTYPDNVWIPTVEPDLDGAVITDSASNLIAAGKMKDLPRIVGNVRNEGLVFSGGLTETLLRILRPYQTTHWRLRSHGNFALEINMKQEFYANETKFEVVLSEFDDAVPQIMKYYTKVGDLAGYNAAIKSFYFNNDLTGNISALLSNFTDFAGDSYFVYPALHLIENHLVFAQNPTFYYSFEYRGTTSSSTIYTGGSTIDYGVAHGDELMYMFPKSYEMSEADKKMVDILVDLLTSFAINGTPTTSAVSDADIWQPYSLNNTYLRIGNNSDVTPRVQSGLHEARMQFWRELIGETASGASSLTSTCLVLPLVVYIIAR